MNRQWPATPEELEAQAKVAQAKYQPLVARLTAGELLGLVNACSEELATLRAEARAEAIRHGARPPGTRIGH